MIEVLMVGKRVVMRSKRRGKGNNRYNESTPKDVKTLSKSITKSRWVISINSKNNMSGKNNVGKFDLYRNTKTGEITLKSKDRRASIPTNIFIN
ncbi:hypothetical protein BBW65_05670 [Helicobacter enhydrae]|uniref:Uncharacterized protein n=1 Tax=Helicobacter enhydrae TaxID=222136 RepID=A0A1B1U691_9HELI|nr:hypothetical protein [Helicobacter enhydrae]ANV98317.1 hypothetical protein BBW65_05670 [Helicobacter enhydrae]